ncbi:hypothetical protein C3469_13195 [Mycobacterium kansasii]|nr:hypothetical protein C3B43_18565 [Mycobacterium kansasii]POX92383.1 hypothetical protein C3477_28380 [Mycobacterium kansasii]POY01881.1 hypothetical protein C3479_11090 [Mycobacterium kansasii]POY20244.1 hypothetical protein C3476_15665 [Mycobacterium kansasii]POY27023.1 hypothetical protein C3469_13195 [Mycobacterium kansasii]
MARTKGVLILTLSPRRQAFRPAGRVSLCTPRVWLGPIIVAVALMYGLGLFYVGGALNPGANLRHFPIAIVNQDTGMTGRLIADGLAANMDRNQFDIRVLPADQARDQLETGKVYAQVLLPWDLSQRLFALPEATLQPGQPLKPVITISTGQRSGAVAAVIAEKAMRKALAVVNARAGTMLTAQLRRQSDGAPVPGGALMVLASPIDVDTIGAEPPDGGSGVSVLYCSLLLVIGGVTAAVVVSLTAGALLRSAPVNHGRWQRLADRIRVSRLQALLVEWTLLSLLALPTSAVCLGIAVALGMPAPQLLAVWLFGAFIVATVGVMSSSLIAALGTWGALISVFVFIFLGIPSAGATIPLEASPRFVAWLAEFEPVRQAFLGCRSLLYSDGAGGAELIRSVTVCALGLGIALSAGALVTYIRDRDRLPRIEVSATC